MIAKSLSTRVMSADPKLPAELQQAVAAHRRGDVDAAMPMYVRFLDSHPDNPAALQLLGLLHSQRGEYEQAIIRMQESLRRFPEQPEVANNLANALSRAGRADEALQCYALAIRLNPDYADAIRNLGLCHLECGRPMEAAACFQRCLELDDGDAVAWMSLGLAHKKLDAVDKAIQCFQKALDLRPDYAEAHHNLGVCLRMRRRSDEAIDHYAAARRLGVDRAELYYNLGNALLDRQDVEGAIEAYRAAVRRNPDDMVSHRNLNTLLWEQERLEDYLESYRQVLSANAASLPHRLAYATALNQQEQFSKAEEVLKEGLRHAPDSPDLADMLAYSLERQGRWTEALRMHESAVGKPGAAANHHISLARALLACGRPDDALPHARKAALKLPLSQLALAYLGLCWRMLGDARDEELNDYRGLVRVYDVPLPKGFANAQEFNDALDSMLLRLHVGKRHPPEQTLRGGTQTHGDLFNRIDPEIQGLVSGLRQCIQEYVALFPNDAQHPLYSRRAEGFDFSGSWSVRLQRCGYHTMHVHPMGWISSAYYVRVPKEIRDTDALGGAIKFGEPDIDLGRYGAARKVIQPSEGKLILFPSYMWHGTVPFEADDARTTVAFDVIPVRSGD